MTPLSPYLNDLLNQPQALRDTLSGLPEHGTLARFTEGLWHSSHLQTGKYRRILLTGMGSSYHVQFPLRYRLAQQDLCVELIETSELIHYAPALLKAETLVVVVSQSGHSAEVVHLLELVGQRAHKFAIDVIGITNSPGSPLARQAGAVIYLNAGEEFTVSCKTYLASLAALCWLGDELLPDAPAQLPALAEVPRQVETYLAGWQEHVQALKVLMGGVSNMYYVGRGDSLAAVGTGGLITKEAAHFPAEGMSAAAFRHGPLEGISGRVFTLVFRGAAKTADLNARLMLDIQETGGKAALVREADTPGVFNLPRATPGALPLLEILPVEMFTLALAELKGRVAGQFERGSKVTLVE
jgi:glucosamine--fructose-6-phosphate aminotransferase (isomerizing)